MNSSAMPRGVPREACLPRILKPWTARRRQVWRRLTAFQRQVYRAICRIPRGQTRSYQWVAARIRRPRAARAVGTALHRNPFAPKVPCHRVVRADGSLGGYARGLAKKQALLRQEKYPRSRKVTSHRVTSKYAYL